MKYKENITKNLILPLPLECLRPPHFIGACFKTGGRAPPYVSSSFTKLGARRNVLPRAPKSPRNEDLVGRVPTLEDTSPCNIG